MVQVCKTLGIQLNSTAGEYQMSLLYNVLLIYLSILNFHQYHNLLYYFYYIEQDKRKKIWGGIACWDPVINIQLSIVNRSGPVIS